MKIVFVHDTASTPYSIALVTGKKTSETRSRNTLAVLCGEEVLVARTRSGSPTKIVGSIVLEKGAKVDYKEFRERFNEHLVPDGSKFDCKKNGYRWCYQVSYSKVFNEPIEMPKNIIRHGRTWAEIKED